MDTGNGFMLLIHPDVRVAQGGFFGRDQRENRKVRNYKSLRKETSSASIDERAIEARP